MMMPDMNTTACSMQEILIDGGTTFLTVQHPGMLSLGERIEIGQTLLTLSHLITQGEIDFLVSSSIAAAEASLLLRDPSKSDKKDVGMDLYDCARMSTMAAAKRRINNYSADDDDDDDVLSMSVSLSLEAILERILTFIDQHLCPSLKTTLFGMDIMDDDTPSVVSIAELFRTDQLIYTDQEPAINVYTAPDGKFDIHKDNKALTILVPLSSPMGDFTGGGTAFWSELYPVDGMDDPSFIMTPQPGTVMLFGGAVSHKGMPIQTGTRVVFVASFSRSSCKAKSSFFNGD
jgi:hypothetical protein